jgi:hypothetical protein
MAGYIKIGDIKGESAQKIGDIKGEATRKPGSAGYTEVEWTYAAKAKLQQAGVSQPGVNALVSGTAMTDPQDRKVVASILAEVLK